MLLILAVKLDSSSFFPSPCQFFIGSCGFWTHRSQTLTLTLNDSLVADPPVNLSDKYFLGAKTLLALEKPMQSGLMELTSQ